MYRASDRLRDRRLAVQQVEGLADRVVGDQALGDHRGDIVARDLAVLEPLGERDLARTRVVGEAAGTHDRVVEPALHEVLVGLGLGLLVGAHLVRPRLRPVRADRADHHVAADVLALQPSASFTAPP